MCVCVCVVLTSFHRFWKKLQRIEDPNDLNKFFDVPQLRLPDAVFKCEHSFCPAIMIYISQLRCATMLSLEFCLRIAHHLFRRRKGQKEPVFGCPLSEAVKRRPTESGLPLPLEKAAEAIRARFMQVEGIFRISGMVKPIELLRKSYDAVRYLCRLIRYLGFRGITVLAKLPFRGRTLTCLSWTTRTQFPDC